jgi:hypothetical protein
LGRLLWLLKCANKEQHKQKKTEETRIGGGNNSLSVIMLDLVGGGPALQGRETASSKVG